MRRRPGTPVCLTANQPGFRVCGAPRAAHVSMSTSLLQIHVDVLLTREAQQFLDAFLAADAGLLVTAKRRAEEMLRDLVDPHEAGLDRRGRTVCSRQIIGPDRTGQSILDLVYLREHLVLVPPLEYGQD